MKRRLIDRMKALNIEKVTFGLETLYVLDREIKAEYLISQVLELVEEDANGQRYGAADVVTLKNMPFEYQYFYNPNDNRYYLQID